MNSAVTQKPSSSHSHAWLKKTIGHDQFQCRPLSGDASFRRYHRVHEAGKTFILMDMEKELATLPIFTHIAHDWQKHGIDTPHIYAADPALGLVLMQDFGAEHLGDDPKTLQQRVHTALVTLQAMQRIPDTGALPHYSEALLSDEMNLFQDWFLNRHHGITLDDTAQETLQNAQQHLTNMARAQPQVTVHRDYHSRNLMWQSNARVGVLDFQDAVIGPITYDLVSLLRDCYVDYPSDWVTERVAQYHQHCMAAGLIDVPLATFTQWFDWMGLQRHLKCLGIFCRLNHRDQKPDYLQYLPRVLGYAQSVCERYEALGGLGRLLETPAPPA